MSQPSPAVPLPLGLAAWEEYPTLKMLMEMVMTKYVSTRCWDRLPGGPGHAVPRRRAQARPRLPCSLSSAASWAPVTVGWSLGT